LLLLTWPVFDNRTLSRRRRRKPQTPGLKLLKIIETNRPRRGTPRQPPGPRPADGENNLQSGNIYAIKWQPAI
jgi:hypothetical protein